MRRILFPVAIGVVAVGTAACAGADAEKIVAAEAVAATETLNAQTGASVLENASRRHRRGPRHRDPIARLLANKDRIGLTSDQVSRLEAIRSELRAKNEPLFEQVRTTLGFDGQKRPMRKWRNEMTPEQQAEWKQKREAVRPIMEQIRANHREAREASLAVLTPEQVEKLKAERAERREKIRDKQGRRDRAGRNAG